MDQDERIVIARNAYKQFWWNQPKFLADKVIVADAFQ